MERSRDVIRAFWVVFGSVALICLALAAYLRVWPLALVPLLFLGSLAAFIAAETTIVLGLKFLYRGLRLFCRGVSRAVEERSVRSRVSA